ncbi:ATPase [Paenibacillus aquistagni]|nr:ATPase [Paenibacillus aquistagni]NMM51874.1 ATPase [Paenibacillus aquistagni]
MDMNMLFEFIQQNWLIFLIALIILLVVVNVVKTMVKWALVIVIVAAVAVYSGISWNDINQVVTTVKDETVQKLKDQAMQAMVDEAKTATYERNADGSFVIKSDNLELKGTEGSSKVEVAFNGVSLGKWEINDTIKAFMETAKQR